MICDNFEYNQQQRQNPKNASATLEDEMLPLVLLVNVFLFGGVTVAAYKYFFPSLTLES